MPVVQVIDSRSNDDALLSFIFPRRDQDGVWVWDEVACIDSPISGFGLGPSTATGFPWHDVPGTVLMPMLGRETEVGSAIEADIFERILRGVFTLIPHSKMEAALPQGHVCARGRSSNPRLVAKHSRSSPIRFARVQPRAIP